MDGSYDTGAPAAGCGPPPAAGPRRRHGGGEAGQGEAARARRAAGVWRAGRGVQGQLVIVVIILVLGDIIQRLQLARLVPLPDQVTLTVTIQWK